MTRLEQVEVRASWLGFMVWDGGGGVMQVAVDVKGGWTLAEGIEVGYL